MERTAGRTASGLRYQFAAAVIFIGALCLSRTSVESGMNDDWSFIRTVHDLAATGQLRYNGWSAPLIGPQAYWGALFVRVLGFSFLAVRASSWVLILCSLPVLWQLLRSVELTAGQAFFGLVCFLLSPLNLPNLATFMTDMPAFLLFAAALLAAIRAWEASEDRSAMQWVCVTTVCGLLSGGVRQMYWLCGVCFLTVLTMVRLRSRNGRVLIGLCVGITILIAAICTHWLALQPYVPADDTLAGWKETPWGELAGSLSSELARSAICVALLCVPFSLPMAIAETRRVPWWSHVVVVSASISMAYVNTQPLPWLGNTLTSYGVLLPGTVSVGDRPELMSRTMVVVLASVGMASLIYCALMVVRKWREANRDRLLALAFGTGLGRLLILTAPFLLGYLLLLGIRAPEYGLYDRYMIPVIFVFGTAMLGSYARQNRSVGVAGWSAAGVFAIYALATTHDYFAEARAKLAATEEIMRAGVQRDAILSGFEFDLWTQTERIGHINNSLVEFPADAYREAEDCSGPADVQVWWRPLTPDLRQEYVVSISRLTSLRPADFPEVEYRRWIPWLSSRVYVQETAAETTLSCSE